MANPSSHIAPPERTPVGGYRAKLMRVCLVVVGVVCLAALLWYGLAQTRRFLFADNPFFRFRELRMEPTPHFDHARVRTILEELGCVIPSTNLLEVDLRAVRRRLLREPQVEDVELFRVNPGALLIRLRERRPVAFVVRQDGQQFLLLDAHGVLIPFQDRQGLATTTPWIYGAFAADETPQTGVPSSNQGLLAALELLRIQEHRTQIDGAGFHFNAITVSAAHEQLVCRATPFPNNHTIKPNAILYLPLDTEKMEAALDRLDAILKLKLASDETLSFADLTLERNVNTRD